MIPTHRFLQVRRGDSKAKSTDAESPVPPNTRMRAKRARPAETTSAATTDAAQPIDSQPSGSNAKKLTKERTKKSADENEASVAQTDDNGKSSIFS